MGSMFLVAMDLLDCREGDSQLKVWWDLWCCVWGGLGVWIVLCVV